MDGRYDRDGQRIENPIPGDPGGMSAQERADMERAQAYAWHAANGTLGTYYIYFDPHNVPAMYQGVGRERER